MNFTDEDLKRLKEHLSDECYLSTEWKDARAMMPALLHRLECAEKMEKYWKYYEPCSTRDENIYNSDIKSWLLSKGALPQNSRSEKGEKA